MRSDLTSSTAGVIVLDGATLAPEAVAAIARGGARVELAPEARARNDAARRALDTLLARGEQIYGATSGVGALREHRVEVGERSEYSLLLLRSHACGAGASLAPIAARRAHESLAALRVLIATELVVAVRALRLADAEPVGAGTRGLFETAAERLDPDLGDRPLHRDIEAARPFTSVRVLIDRAQRS